MKMRQFAFIQNAPHVTSTALPPLPLNVQLSEYVETQTPHVQCFSCPCVLVI